MKTFKQFVTEEVQNTKRTGMQHFSQIKPAEFIEFVKEIKSLIKAGTFGKIKVDLKSDGLGARFGKDASGKFFFEGSNTGVIYNDNAFSAFATSKGHDGVRLERAYHYDKMFETIKKSDLMSVVPNNCKVICEILYNPMATEDDYGLKFVTVSYDKAKLGTLMTIVPYAVINANDGSPHHDSHGIIKDLVSKSNSSIKVITSDISKIDISGVVDGLSNFDADAVEIVKSRKAIDAPKKANIINIINIMKQELEDYVTTHPDLFNKYKMGKNYEGLVLDILGNKYKMTTDYYKTNKFGNKEPQ